MIDHYITGLVGLVLTILIGIEKSLSDSLAITHMSHGEETVFWIVVVIMCLVAAVRLMGGWIRTVFVLALLGISLHAGITHGLNGFK